MMLISALLLVGVLSSASGDNGNAEGPRVTGSFIAWGSSSSSNRDKEVYIDVYWTKPENVTKYEVEYSKKTIPVLDFRVQMIDARRYRLPLSGLAMPGSFDYDFRVRAFNDLGSGPWDKTLRYISEGGNSGFGAPRNIKVKKITPTTFEVTLSDPPPATRRYRRISIRSYRIFSSYHAGASLTVWNQTVMSLDDRRVVISVEDPSLPFAVRAQARELDGRYGNLSSVAVPDSLETPGAAVHFQAVDVGRTSIRVIWDHPTNWVTNTLAQYELFYTKISGGMTSSVFLRSDATEYLVKRLTPDTTYTFKLTSKFLGEPVGDVSVNSHTSA